MTHEQAVADSDAAARHGNFAPSSRAHFSSHLRTPLTSNFDKRGTSLVFENNPKNRFSIDSYFRLVPFRSKIFKIPLNENDGTRTHAQVQRPPGLLSLSLSHQRSWKLIKSWGGRGATFEFIGQFKGH